MGTRKDFFKILQTIWARPVEKFRQHWYKVFRHNGPNLPLQTASEHGGLLS